MTAVELQLVLEETCEALGVTVRELRSERRASKGKYPAKYSVSLARYAFLFRAWRRSAGVTQTAHLVNMSARSVRRWFSDFRCRAGQSISPEAANGAGIHR